MLAIARKVSDYIFKKQRGWFFCGAAVVATLLLANIWLITGKFAPTHDAHRLAVPSVILFGDCVRQGQLPLWTPLMSGGCPLAMDSGLGAFSPIMIAFTFLVGGHVYSYAMYWLAIWAFGGIGIVVLARYFSAPKWIGYLAAVGFMCCGVYTGNGQHTSIICTLSFLPWIVWRVDIAVRRKSLLVAFEAGALSGLSALNGYPGMMFISCLFVGFWMLVAMLPRGESADSPGETSSRQRKFASMLLDKFWLLARTAIVFYGVTIVVMLPCYLGYAMETRDYTDRSASISRDTVFLNSVLPYTLITAASQYYMTLDALLNVSMGAPQKLFPDTCPSMYNVYFFPVLLILAVAALWQRPRDKLRWAAALLAMFFLATAMGTTFPFRGWLYDLLLPMRYFRHCGIFRAYYIFSAILLVVIAGKDLEAVLLKENGTAWKKFAVLYSLAAVLAIAIFIGVCSPTVGVPAGRKYLNVGIIHLIVVWPAIAALFLVGCWKSSAFRGRILQRYLILFVCADAVLTIIVCKPRLFANPKATATLNRVEKMHVAEIDLPQQGLDRDFDNAIYERRNDCLITKRAAFACYNVFTNEFYIKTVKNPVLYKPALGVDRFWFSKEAALMPLSEESFGRFADRAEGAKSPSLVVSLPSGTAPETAGEYFRASDIDANGNVEEIPPLQPLVVESVDMTSRELNLDVQCPERGWVLITDRWARGWSATVNGRPQPIAIGNFIFRALPVEKGRNQIHFSYCPFGHPWLMIVSWACLAAVCAASIGARISARRKRYAPGSVDAIPSPHYTSECGDESLAA